MFIITMLLLVLTMQLQVAIACRVVHSKSPSLGTLHFEMLSHVPDDSVHSEGYFHSGRQFYRADRPEIRDAKGKLTQRKQPPLYLYVYCVCRRHVTSVFIPHAPTSANTLPHLYSITCPVDASTTHGRLT